MVNGKGKLRHKEKLVSEMLVHDKAHRDYPGHMQYQASK
jgi:hypothetical protein